MPKNRFLEQPEILSPAGSFGALYAAVNGGCDAVYLGGSLFNARMSADNFSDDDLLNAIDHCHLHGVKAYITVNTIYKNNELKQLFKFLEFAYREGADAFIFQDIGAAIKAREAFPNIEIHASTQMNTHSLACARFLKEAGFDRLILSRELNLAQIVNIAKNGNVETEIFVHGALCVGFSGQCLLSSFAGGRSGNRGRCAQPCRIKYKLCANGKEISEGYLLSPKDMSAIYNLKEIAETGVSALKIEGRMKTPGYVYTVTSIYRKYLDMIDSEIDKSDTDKLLQAFNRGGSFNNGYLKSHSGLDMMSVLIPKNSGVFIGTVTHYEHQFKRVFIKAEKDLVPGDGLLIHTVEEPHVGFGVNVNVSVGEIVVFEAKGDILEGDKVYRTFDKKFVDEVKNVDKPKHPAIKRIDLQVSVAAKVGSPMKIKIQNSRILIEVQGEIVQPAKSAPLTAERLIAQINKTDTLPFNIEFTNCEIDDNIYMPISAVNEVRRNAFSKFSDELLVSYRRDEVVSNVSLDRVESIACERRISVSVRTKEQLLACLIKGVSRIYADLSIKDIDYCANKVHELGIEFFISLSRIDINDETADILPSLENTAIDGYLIRTYGQLNLLKSSSKIKVLDSSFNVLNSLSADCLLNFSDEVTLSQELNLREISDINCKKSEVIAYGRPALMTTQQCPVGLYAASKKSDKFCSLKGDSDGYVLKDDNGCEFPIITDCDKCFATIFGSDAMFLLNKAEDLQILNAGGLRLDFTTETADEIKKIIECYIKALNGNNNDKEVIRLIEEYNIKKLGNLGHFYKGII